MYKRYSNYGQAHHRLMYVRQDTLINRISKKTSYIKLSFPWPLQQIGPSPAPLSPSQYFVYGEKDWVEITISKLSPSTVVVCAKHQPIAIAH